MSARPSSFGTKVHSLTFSMLRIWSPTCTAERDGKPFVRYTVMLLLSSMEDIMEVRLMETRLAQPVKSRQEISTPMEAILIVLFFQRFFTPSLSKYPKL